MNRYNQGFKYFGPMEQSDDGDWVKYDDMVDYCNQWIKWGEDMEANRDGWKLLYDDLAQQYKFFAIGVSLLFGIMAATIGYLFTRISA